MELGASMNKEIYHFPAESLVRELHQITRYLSPYSMIESITNSEWALNIESGQNELRETLEKEASLKKLKLEEEFIEILNLFLSEAKPTGIVSLYHVSSSPNGLIDDQGRNIYPFQHPLFRKTSWASFFTIVLSKTIDEWILEFFKGREVLKAYLLEAISLAALNEIQQQIRQILIEHIPQGLTLSYTLTPGSHGLPITTLDELLTLSGGRRVGISHVDEFTLSPLKSLTGIILAGNDFSNIKEECNYCNQRRNCLYKI